MVLPKISVFRKIIAWIKLNLNFVSYNREKDALRKLKKYIKEGFYQHKNNS